MSVTKKLLIFIMTVVSVVTLTVASAFACTMIYVGSDNTSDGSAFLARSEDYSNSYNKIAYVSPAGLHPVGSVYEGCYGFKFTFTHDSYSYTAVRDDNLAGAGNTTGKCPDCYGTHQHTPMEEAGCNEKGVSVSAMVTLSWKDGRNVKNLSNIDNMVSGGMCESDMTTILLSEAATAKEGVDLLLNIYDTIGAEERSGVLIADQKEAWYVENYTGHQYIAVKLSSGMIAISPNMGAIGLVDLDDTANVIASEDVISVAKQAGYFVGDEAAKQIDFRASYSNMSINDRMINGLNYLLGENKFTSANVTDEVFKISNVKNGEIVPLYTNIQTNRKLTAKDMVDFYKVSGIGNTSNLEWHIFQIKSEGAMESSTIEWLGMENGQYPVAIPYFPVLTTDMYEGYKVGGLGKTSNAKTAPMDMYGAFPSGTSYKVLPAGWDSGFYWSVDALSNFALSSACSAEDDAMIHAALAVMQDKCYAKAAEMEASIASMSLADAKAYCTEQSAALAKEAHELTLKLYKHLVYGDETCQDVVTAPGCTESGCTTHVCACGESFIYNVTAPTGHSYKKGVCTVCGDEAEKIAAPKVSVSVKASTGKPVVTWKPVDGASKYIVYVSTSKDGLYTKILTTTGTSCTNASAKPGAKYFYKVKAVSASDEFGDSVMSAAVSCTCKCAAPSGTAGTKQHGNTTLKWKAVNGAKSYVVYAASSKDGSYKKLATVTGTSFADSSVKAGKSCWYKVKAVSENGSQCSATSAAVKAICKTPAPTVKATLKNGDPKLTWKAVDGAKVYVVYRATSPDGNFVKMYTTTNLSYVNSSAKSGVTYYYKVMAVSGKASADSMFSTAVSVKAK